MPCGLSPAGDAARIGLQDDSSGRGQGQEVRDRGRYEGCCVLIVSIRKVDTGGTLTLAAEK
eukprot:11207308-Prorocentrum_lima.AAC.1